MKWNWRQSWNQGFETLPGEIAKKTPATLVAIDPGIPDGKGGWSNRGSTYTVTVEPDLKPPDGERNLILCIDGTWNSPRSRTNVYLLSELLPDLPGRQKVLYYDGVGVRNDEGAALDLQRAKQRLQRTLGKRTAPLKRETRRLLGGAGGRGAAAIRRRVYFDLVCHYQPGDRLFLFGFSRGAAIARTLANEVRSRRGCSNRDLM